MRHVAHVPDVTEDVTSVGSEQVAELAVIIPGPGYGASVKSALRGAKFFGWRRDVGLGAVEPDVALALLFGIVKRMSMKKRPNELAADIFEAEFKVRMLKNSVVPAVKCGSTDIDALLLGDFFGIDDARGIAGACRGDGRIKRMREGIAKGNARRGGFDERV